MAASAIIALVSTATAVATTVGGVAAFSFLGMTGFAAVATSFLVSTAMGAALNALAPKPSLGAISRGYSIAGESGAALDHQIIYGEVRVGGVRVYDASTGDTNKFLHRIIAFAGHEVQGYQQIYLNDEVVTLDVNGNVTSPSRYNGFVRIKRYFGTTAQTADPDLVAETAALTDGRWTTDHRLQGIAYLYIRFQYNADAFPNGLPTVSATIRGKKVFDPRTNTTAWSDNPALCLRDYIASDYGLAQPSGSIEDNLVEDAADWCDDVVDSQKRYTCNGNFVTSFEPSQILSDMLTSMGGLLWYSQGKWRMKAAKYTTPTITLDENDLRSGISLSTRHSRRSNFNTVKGKFKGAESDWQEADYPVVSDPAFVAADNNIVNTLDFSLPFTTSSKTAQRIANIALRRNREQLTFSASFGLKAFQVDVGDFVYVNNTRFGWSNKAFEVTNWTFGLTEGLDLQVQMTLREISSAVFTDEAAAAFENNNTNLYNFRDVPDVSIFLSNSRVVSNQQVINNIATFVSSNRVSEIDFVELQYAPSEDPDFKEILVAELGNTQIKNVESGRSYTVRARAVNQLGLRGDWTYATIETFVDYFRAGDINNISLDTNNNGLSFGWDTIEDESLSHVQIRHSVLEDGSAVWPDATTDTERVARPATNVTIPARPGTFMLRAVSKTGGVSSSQTSVVVTSGDLPNPYSNTTTATENPTFGGTKQNTEVVSSTLRIDQDTILVDVIDDIFQEKWETDSPFPSGNILFAYFWVYFPDDLIGVVQAKKTNAETYSFWQDVSDSAGVWQLHYRVLPYYIPPSIAVGDFPPDGYFTVSLGDSGEIPMPMSPGEHTLLLNVGTAGGRVTFTRNLAVKTREEFTAPSFINMNEFELVKIPNVYTHQNNIDVGAVKQVRLTQFVKTTRHHADGNVFDSISGNWDTWAGVFDEWTGDDRPADTDVDVYYSKSNDNTNWSDWVKFRATTVTGRYFKFKSELKSYRPHKVTPAISELKVKAEYN